MKNKKGFILYADIQMVVNKLSDDYAGKLFKHILAYVNDENPTTNDLLLEIAFEPIKQQLKRDLLQWTETKAGRSKAGLASAEKKKQNKIDLTNSTNVESKQQDETKSTVNVNDNVNVNVIVNKDIVSRKLKFSDSLKPFINFYARETLNDFYKYWTEPNKSNTKFRQELEKTWDTKRRLENWTRNDKSFKKETEVITFKKPFK